MTLIAVTVLGAACDGGDLREELTRAEERAEEAERRADEAEERVEELESRLENQGPTEAPAPVEEPESEPPPGGDEAEVGETVMLNGYEATVVEVQRPAEPNRTMILDPEPGNEFVALDAQFCTSERADSAASVSQSDFRLLDTSDGRWEYWNVQDYARDPRFPTSEEVRPGDCVRGWITYQIPQNLELVGIDFRPSKPQVPDAEWALN